MGSVIDTIECPNCKSEDSCYVDFYYKTGEEYTSCGKCGYYHSLSYRRDDNHELVKKDPAKGLEFDNLFMDETILNNPFGAYHVTADDSGVGLCGSLANEDEYHAFIEHNISNKNTNGGTITISRFVDNEFKEEIHKY